MESLNITFRLLASSQILLFMLLIGFSKNDTQIKIVGVLLMLGILSYLGMPYIETFGSEYWVGFLWLPASITPSLMLLFVWFTFEECSTTPKWIYALTGFSILASLWLRFYNIGLPESPLWIQLLKIGIVVVAIGVVLHGRESDLVERRQTVRYVFVLTQSFLILLVMSIELATEFAVPVKLDVVTAFAIFSFSTALNFYMIRFNPSIELVGQAAPTEPPKDDPVINELLERMTTERLYADHDLRVGSLASMLNVPEYQLRQKINQKLGFRNFNQFVNHYRIEEAGQKLMEDKRLPVLSIALDVGFRSISSFNTAFQSQYSVSPSKYRAEHRLATP
jgi:AraC-like DNA-binding protein